MNDPLWMDVGRVLVFVGLIIGVWRGWKNLPSHVLYKGRKFYPQRDGRFLTALGRAVKDPIAIAALKASVTDAETKCAVRPSEG